MYTYGTTIVLSRLHIKITHNAVQSTRPRSSVNTMVGSLLTEGWMVLRVSPRVRGPFYVTRDVRVIIFGACALRYYTNSDLLTKSKKMAFRVLSNRMNRLLSLSKAVSFFVDLNVWLPSVIHFFV